MDISGYFKIIEDAIAKIGIDPAACRGGNDGQWSMRRGTVDVWVDVWNIEREGRPYFQVMSPLMLIPENTPTEFFREALEINDRLYSVALAIFDNRLWIKVIRECAGIDADEAYAMIIRVGTYAAEYEPYLREKYFGGGGGGSDAGQAPIV